MPASEPESRFDWRGLLTRENAIAAATVGAGSALAVVGGGMLGQEPNNYAHSGFLDGLIEVLLAAAVLFAVGGYLAAAVPWALGRRERDYVPAMVVAGAFLGAGIGSVVFMPFASWLLLEVAGLLVLATAVAFARLAMRHQRPRPAAWSRWVRLPVVAIAGLWLASTLTMARTDFPGAEAPMPERRAWAVKTFGEAYTQAEAYLRLRPEVTQRLGAIEALAPTEGENRTAYSPGELMGEFTIEVKGARGTGVAHVRFMHGSSSQTVESYGFNGELMTPTGTVALP